MPYREIGAVSFIVTAIALGGCTPVQVVDVGGSKADATVIMGAHVGPFQSPDSIDWTAAESVARQRCMAWGYKTASAFTGIRSQCLDRDCMNRELSRTFQCLD